MPGHPKVTALISVAAIVVAVLLVAAPLRERLGGVSTVASGSYRSIRHTTFEQRRRALYGDCDKHGYGYVARIMVGFPEPRAVPVLHATYDPRVVAALLPGVRRVVEERVVMGAGVPAAETNEFRVASARRVAPRAGEPEEWEFATERDVDALTALEFTFTEAGPPSPAAVTVTLLYSREFPIDMGTWVIPRGTNPVMFRLREPLARFSLGRESNPFVLRVSAGSGPSIQAIGIYGLRVDIRGHVVVNREGDCFTAIRRDLLAEIENMPGHPWAPYLATIRNVRLD